MTLEETYLSTSYVIITFNLFHTNYLQIPALLSKYGATGVFFAFFRRLLDFSSTPIGLDFGSNVTMSSMSLECPSFLPYETLLSRFS